MTLQGHCEHCGTLHIGCPDCGIVFGVTEGELEEVLKCPGSCGRIYILTYGGRESTHVDIEIHDQLDIALLAAASNNARKYVTEKTVRRIIDTTRWKYFTEESPTLGLTESELMEWQKDGQRLAITSEDKL